LNTYTLTIATAGDGSGVVTPTVGAHPYLYGSVATLEATTSSTSTFSGWSGNADCTDGLVTMDADKACTATFTLNTYTLTVATVGNGIGSVMAFANGTVLLPTQRTQITHGTVVSLTATHSPTSTFAGWSGAVLTTTNPLVLTIDSNKDVTATFTLAVTNQSPMANAGVNQNVKSATLITLDGSGSSDPDGNLPLTYGWTQTGGPLVILSSTVISQPIFTAPKIVTQTATLTFALVVTDSLGLASVTPAQVAFTIEPYCVFLPVALKQ
jgi:hypothetical protein